MQVSRGKYPEPEALAVARQLASVLKHLRDLGVVHRDLKVRKATITSES
jgi:serine/threonine protein kinase